MCMNHKCTPALCFPGSFICSFWRACCRGEIFAVIYVVYVISLQLDFGKLNCTEVFQVIFSSLAAEFEGWSCYSFFISFYWFFSRCWEIYILVGWEFGEKLATVSFLNKGNCVYDGINQWTRLLYILCSSARTAVVSLKQVFNSKTFICWQKSIISWSHLEQGRPVA